MSKDIKAKRIELEPGKVSPEHLSALISLTDIRSEALKQALHDHLVNGLSSTEAWAKHGVNKSQGSRRLTSLREKSRTVRQIAKFYRKG